MRPWLVLDEGGAVAGGAFPGVSRPAAVVGVAEKGILDVELLTRDPGGHASTPPRMGATARLARAITRIERSPFPQSLPDGDRGDAAAVRPAHPGAAAGRVRQTWPCSGRR